MASPFRLFRKYQKSMLVVAGVGCMFAFVLADPLMRLIGGNGGGPRSGGSDPKAVAVRWDGGKLTNEELGRAVVRRRIKNEFTRSVEQLGRLSAFQAGVEPRPLRVNPIMGAEAPQDGVEQDLVYTRLLANLARDAGMEVSDEMILQYLSEIGRNRVSGNEMSEILKSFRGGQSVPVDYVFEALREEMLARNLLASYQFSLETVLPEQRWQDWLQVNDRVIVEAAAIPVESFVIDVPEPTEEELTEFFAQYQAREQQPDFVGNTELPSSVPGFAAPRRVDVQYLLADFDSFLTQLETEITDEEVEQYYNDNKDLFVRAESAFDSGLFDSLEDIGVEEAVEDAGETTDADDAVIEEDVESADEASDEEEIESNGNGESSSFLLEDRETRYVNFQPETDVEAEAVTDVEVTEIAEPETTEPEIEYQPLEDVQDSIRRLLAERRVYERFTELMSKLMSRLNGEYLAYFSKVLDAEADDSSLPEPPAKLIDFEALAEENGLEFGRTGPVSFLELRDLPLGLSAKADEGNVPLMSAVFSRDSEIYRPFETFDLDNNRYLAMKMSDTPGSIPALDDVRDEVVQAWKHSKAADLATEYAEEQAKLAEEAGQPLKEFFTGDSNVTVTTSDPFSWWSAGLARSTGVVPFHLSVPDGIEAAGPDFMNAVFELDADAVGAVLNHDHSIAYVVRIDQHLDSPEKLKRDFLTEADRWYGLPTMIRGRRRQSMQVLMADVVTAAGVQWERDPDRVLVEE